MLHNSQYKKHKQENHHPKKHHPLVVGFFFSWHDGKSEITFHRQPDPATDCGRQWLQAFNNPNYYEQTIEKNHKMLVLVRFIFYRRTLSPN